MYFARSFGSVLLQQRQIDQIVGFACETGATIIPALDDVQR